MGNTFFYDQIAKNVDSITWREIFSNSFKHHSKQDLDRVLATGTNNNRVTEEDMLAKWEKPWLWFPVLKFGLLAVLLAYMAYWIPYFLFHQTVVFSIILMGVIPPLVIPIVVMIFLWELNIPKNISLMECFAYWLIGGVTSLVITLLLTGIIDHFDTNGITSAAHWAPLTEEPAKLIASIIIMVAISRRKKIYGLTGLVIGACVGAGFGALESVQYALSNILIYGLKNLQEVQDEVISIMTQTQFMRAIGGLSGHTLYCAPYAAAVAYNAYRNRGKITFSCFTSQEFIVTFAFSYLMHFCHNYNFTDNFGISFLISLIWIVLSWIMLLWILKRCLYQVVSAGSIRSHSSGANISSGASIAENTISIIAVNGTLNGRIWRQSAGGVISFGRNNTNTVQLPGNAHGISRMHCAVEYKNGAWQVADLNSTYGTFVNISRLPAGGSVRLNDGDLIKLGGSEHVFKVSISR